MKLKRSKTIPLILLIYLICISVYAYPGRDPKMHITWGQYIGVIIVTLLCIILLSYTLKKRDAFRDKNRKNKKQ